MANKRNAQIKPFELEKIILLILKKITVIEIHTTQRRPFRKYYRARKAFKKNNAFRSFSYERSIDFHTKTGTKNFCNVETKFSTIRNDCARKKFEMNKNRKTLSKKKKKKNPSFTLAKYKAIVNVSKFLIFE